MKATIVNTLEGVMRAMNPIPTFQVDAFSAYPFKGNPAAVCVLEQPLDEGVMQKIAMEMNLSETAFCHPLDDGAYSLRWFTPTVEVPLCGHATLATAKVLFDEMGYEGDVIRFQTKSGELAARKDGEGISLDFPADTTEPCEPSAELLAALGIDDHVEAVKSISVSRLLLRVKDADAVKKLRPDFSAMSAADDPIFGVIVTAEGAEGCDFVSRYFAPWRGVDEDPVTGAAHTVLTPYWAERLGKKEMAAYQASERGGKLLVEVTDHGRVILTGKAVVVLRGRLSL